MDPLSDILSVLKLRSYVSGGFDASGEWAVHFGSHEGIKFHAVVTGECWVAVDCEAPVKVKAGECFLLARGKPVRLASNMAAEPISLQFLLPPTHDGRIVTYNKGGEFLSIGGYFTLADGQADMLLNVLPPFIHIRNEPSRATIRWCVERMRQELCDPQPGDFVVAQQLATMVLVEALRLHLSARDRDEVGWLFALGDERMRAALSAMHASPGSPWTLQLMAKKAGMSRTTFATRFKEKVGLSPMEYMTRWRMILAADRLTNSTETLSEIGHSLGYNSEKSFGTAFKRVMNYPPRQYAKL
ncbi:AraC family transcriptional regulator [Acidisoma silvae]|uniref:AraC family transcriptional regulator n=1 Tax=Acidisoma silvae TaxID=2802396 RepID=A0A963YVW8_9PROT|nr:AraC family transcriptional regulator [Acidisoma silvae]MCB8877901.1 AraC family transcriptional regulator [Acidisoma silvae]